MKMKKFEQKIRNEMLKSSVIVIILMLLVAIGLIAIYSISIKNYRLDKTIENYSEIIPTIISNHENKLYKQNSNVFNDYIYNNSEVNKSQLYSTFYTFNSQEEIKSDLLILNENLEPLMSTNIVFEENYAFINYLRIVINNINKKTYDTTLRVYRGTNNESYLLYLYPYVLNEGNIGYGVSIINGKEFQVIIEDSLANFILVDNYNNILSANNNNLVMESTGKLNNEFLDTQNYTMERGKIFDNLSVITYLSNETQMNVLITTIILLLLATLFVVLYSYQFAKKISNRTGQSLYLLNYELNKVKTVPHHLINIKTEDEFEDLADEVNKMLIELRYSHKKNMELSRLNMNSEKRKLEAQFHPHFLANTLETIRSAMYVDIDIANEVLLRMNSLLRYSIDEKDEETKLSEDVEYLKNYLSINRIRFDDFNYGIEIDKKLEHIIVPKLFLLPLIENSLKYGFMHRRDLKIKILGIQKGDKIIFRVIDNGNALPKSESKKINHYINSTEPSSYHHGLKNTKQRLSLLYPNSSFRICSKLNCTVVEIKMEV